MYIEHSQYTFRMPSRKQLRSTDKAKVLKVFNYFKDKEAYTKTVCISKTVEATGTSQATICRILKELRETGTLLSPVRRKRGAYKPMDVFDQDVIRSKVREFYTHGRVLPTLKKLHGVLREEIHYPGSRETLRKILKELGFGWRRTSDNRKMLMEKSAVLTARLKFHERKQELK